MSAQFRKLTVVGVTSSALLAIAASAFAAPSLGLAANRPYYGSSHHATRSWNVRQAAPSYTVTTRQSYSHEPAVQSVAPAPAVKSAEVKPQPQAKVATAPQATRRSYSYEPMSGSAVQHSHHPAKDQWLRSKAEAHRYSQ